MLVFPPPPPRSFFSKPLSVCHFLWFFSSVFHFDFAFYVHQPLLRYYSRFASLALSLLPLSFLRFCFVPSNQFRSIPFSNPPCFHFRSFRSSILPLCTLVFSGLAFPSFLFVLFFLVCSDCCSHLFHHWKLYSWFLFLLFLVVQVWRRLFWFQAKALFSKPLSACHSLLLLFLFLSSISTLQGFFFMSPTFELTLSFAFFGVLFLAPLHSSFLLRSFHPVGSHLLLQSTLLLFLVFSLFYSSSLDATFFSAWLTLPSCFFLLVLVWGASHCCCSHFLFHLDFSAQFLFLVCLVDQLWRRLIFFVIELINAKGGFPAERTENKKKNKSNNGTQGFAQLRVRCVARVLTGRGGALN